MPSNKNFILQILVNGNIIPEYHYEDKCYVESNLFTCVSYQQQITEEINGEVEQQTLPVTPYTIVLRAKPKAKTAYYRVLVDGVKVKGLSLGPGETKTIKGFKDGSEIREFLFSLSRFPKDEMDCLTCDRQVSVGKIEVECWKSKLRKKRSGRLHLRRETLAFQQASKNDSSAVTKGDYTMITSKAGKPVGKRQVRRMVDKWRLISLRSRLCVYYRMDHTLKEMGFQIHPYLVNTKHHSKSEYTSNGVVIEHPTTLSRKKDVKYELTSVKEKTEDKALEDVPSGTSGSPLNCADSENLLSCESDIVMEPLAVVQPCNSLPTFGADGNLIDQLIKIYDRRGTDVGSSKHTNDPQTAVKFNSVTESHNSLNCIEISPDSSPEHDNGCAESICNNLIATKPTAPETYTNVDNVEILQEGVSDNVEVIDHPSSQVEGYVIKEELLDVSGHMDISEGEVIDLTEDDTR